MNLFTSLLLILSVNSYAAQDSVGVFYKPEKVIILINEINGAPRLQGFMNALGAGDSFHYESFDKNIRFKCGRDSEKASCTFTVLPGAQGKITPRQAEAFISAIELNVKSDYKMTFESSMKDRFTLTLNSESLEFLGTKK